MKTEGTPKSLRQAIEHGLANSVEHYMDGDVNVIRVFVKDFLAQKFSVAVFEAKVQPYSEKDLMKLFEVCSE